MPYSVETLNKIWDKGIIIKGKNPNKYRKDVNGNEMYKASYGKYSKMGWNVDHKKAKANGGSDSLRNLQPMNSRANSSKGKKNYETHPL
ncbi:MAG: HNH endonuclease [Bacteroidales bacterium]|nr:HNH endonuclease [Bacteroidales bacterium]